MEEENSGLEKLKKRLYKEENPLKDRMKREALPLAQETPKTQWSDIVRIKEEDFTQRSQNMPKTKGKKFNSILIFGLLAVFLVVSGTLFYLFYSGLLGGNVVSSKNIQISLTGPSLVNAGELNSWVVFVKNDNQATLEVADLVITYPVGSVSARGEKVSVERRALGEILPGASTQEEFSFFVLGKEQEQGEINLTLEYRMAGSNAIFAKEEKQTIEFSRSPMGVSLTLPKEIESGQEMKAVLVYVSNSEVVLKNMYVQVEYPAGFQFLSSNIEPIEGNNLWKVGDLMPQEERQLEIKGILEGQDMTELTFRSSVGPLDEEGKLDIFSASTATTLLKSPFLNFAFLVNGKDIDAVYKDEKFNISIPFKNNLPNDIRNLSLVVKLIGKIINFKTIFVQGGFYRGYDNTIVWNSSSMPEFGMIAPGAGGVATFSFVLLDTFPVNNISDKNFIFSLDGQMTGFRSGGDGQSTEVKSVVKKDIKVSSNIQLASEVLYRSGPFTNSGPLPPKVGQETTYTVMWSISNFYNDVSDVTVRATLPLYASWRGVFDPKGEDLVYNPATGEVIWKIKTVEAGTGILKPVKQVAFQIGFLPSVNQVGQTPMLLGKASLSGKDSFTELMLEDSKGQLNTNSIREAQINSFSGIVVQ